MIDPTLRDALETRAVRGQNVGADVIWRGAIEQLDRAPVDEDLASITSLEPVEIAPDSSRWLWLGAVASLILIIFGGTLTASGVRSRSETNTAGTSEDNSPLGDEAPILHFEGTPIDPWRPMPLDADTLIVETQLGAIDFVILFSPGQAADVQTIGDLAPPSLACDSDIAATGGFPDSCLARPRNVQSDQTTTVSGIDGDIRLVERTGDFTQTTATFLRNDQDVVRVVGSCSAGCVKQALTLLREGEDSDVLGDTPGSPVAGRIFVGITILTMGFLYLLIVRRLLSGAPRDPGAGMLRAIRPNRDW